MEGYLALERENPETSYEALHIIHKALYDAVNEAILGVYRAANRIQVRVWVGLQECMVKRECIVKRECMVKRRQCL